MRFVVNARPSHIEKGPALSPIVHRALHKIREHFASPGFCLGHCAATLKISPFYLEHLLSKSTGKGFRRHLIEVRIAAAVELLADTELSMKEIAYAAGFNTASTFDRVFRREFACCPREYRKVLRTQPDSKDC